MEYTQRPPRSESRLGVLAATLFAVCILGFGLYLFRSDHHPAFEGAAQAEPRAVVPKSPPDTEEVARIKFFKAAKGSVANVDILMVQRNLFDRSLVERPFGSGSGIVWDDAGHVVTNLHVVREAIARGLKVRVILADRTAWDARVVGFDEDNDLAVVKIDAPKEKLKPVPVGTSNDLEVGQTVYAIGNPFGQSLTLTQGIISAVDREIQSQGDRVIRGAIQTDAALNPGNSGGPLFDKDGRLIGVNTAIKTPSGGSVGIGFAIPVDTVNQVVPRLIAEGQIPKLNIVPVREDVVRKAGFDTGVMIQEVKPGTAAADAGLRGLRRTVTDFLLGDIIVALDGKPVQDYAALQKMLRDYKIGDVITLKILRDGKREMSVEVKLRGGE